MLVIAMFALREKKSLELRGEGKLKKTEATFQAGKLQNHCQ